MITVSKKRKSSLSMMKVDNSSMHEKLTLLTVVESNFLFKSMPYLQILEATKTILKPFKPFQKATSFFLLKNKIMMSINHKRVSFLRIQKLQSQMKARLRIKKMSKGFKRSTGIPT